MLVTALLSQCCLWRCQGDIARGVMSLPSRIGNGIAELLSIA
jgi:hypothetical protein